MLDACVVVMLLQMWVIMRLLAIVHCVVIKKKVKQTIVNSSSNFF